MLEFQVHIIHFCYSVFQSGLAIYKAQEVQVGCENWVSIPVPIELSFHLQVIVYK